MIRSILVLLAFVSAFALAARADPARPTIPEKRFDVVRFGAVGDGRTDGTHAIQNAIEAAADAGGGVVVLPPSTRSYLSGPLHLRSRVRFHLEKGATLQPLPYGAGSNTPGTYPLSGRAYANFITGEKVHDVAITGAGTIDGAGVAWWAAFRADKKMPHRPYLVRFSGCTNVLVADVTLTNSPSFHLAFSSTDYVTVEGITILAPADAPNTDGIDPAGSHYLIRRCRVSTGDDNIAVKAGGSFCSDIRITDCTFGTGHGLSVGGQSNRGLDGMIVTNCTFNGTTSGLRLKADATQGGPVRNIIYTNLTMTDVKYPIVFYSYYNKTGNPGNGKSTPAVVAAWNAAPPSPLDSSTIPTWRNIIIRDLTITGASGHSVIWGLPLAEGFFSDVHVINLHYAGEKGFLLYNARNIGFSATDIRLVGGAAPFTTYNALAIVQQSGNQLAHVGGTAVFEIVVAGGGASGAIAPTVRWTFEGKPLADGPQSDGTIVSGAGTAKLELKNVQPDAAGRYVAVVNAALDAYDPGKDRLVSGSVPATATSLVATLIVENR